jgi:hypothetical protein
MRWLAFPTREQKSFRRDECRDFGDILPRGFGLLGLASVDQALDIDQRRLGRDTQEEGGEIESCD